MKLQKITAAVLALGVSTLATAGEFSVASVTDIQTIITGSNNSGSTSDDAAELLAVVTGVTVDDSDGRYSRNPDGHYETYVGLGFDLSESNANARSGYCSGNGRESHDQGNSYCGDPSPSE
jgi:hypothetical protein